MVVCLSAIAFFEYFSLSSGRGKKGPLKAATGGRVVLSGTREVPLTCLHTGWRGGVESEAGVALAGWVDWCGFAFDPGGSYVPYGTTT